MSQLKETCNLLDETLLDYFTTLEEVYKKQTELNDCIKEGFLLMAKVMVPSKANSHFMFKLAHAIR